MDEVCGFDHQIQDRVEQGMVMERDERQTSVSVADELIRSVTGRRVKCDCRRWEGEGRDEDGTGLKREVEIRHGCYKDLPHRRGSFDSDGMGGSQPSKSKKGAARRNRGRIRKKPPSAYRSLKPVEEENSNQLVTDLGFFPSLLPSLPFHSG